MSSADWKETLAKVKISSEETGFHEDEFLSLEDLVTVKKEALERSLRRTLSKKEALERSLRRTLSDLEELFRENRWEDALVVVYPLEEKMPEMVESGMDCEVRAKAAFALGQIGRFDEAIHELTLCVEKEPDRFLYHSSLAYTAYNSLYAGMNREIFLRGRPRMERIALAHAHFRKAQELRPRGVTNFYREGMLFKQIERKTEKSIPLFERAAGNWENMEESEKKERMRERKNYVKSLYQLASALLETN